MPRGSVHLFSGRHGIISQMLDTAGDKDKASCMIKNYTEIIMLPFTVIMGRY